MPENKERKNKGILFLILGLLLIFLAFLFFFVRFLQDQGWWPGSQSFGVLPESVTVEIPYDELPADALYVTDERKSYQRGAMRLIVPSLDIDTLVGESTEPEVLEKMPGLYEVSQMPAWGDVNVSIAGHRDIYDMVFYSLDKLEEGDFLYLVYRGHVFQYLFRENTIVKPSDWDVIGRQGFSCLTLTTCDPIGTTLNRLIATSELIGIIPLTEDYQYLAKEETP